MSDYKNKIVLITGASSGIGKEFARQFASKGAKLALIARRLDLLQELARELREVTSEVQVIQADLTTNDLKNILNWIQENKPDILVNNAGFGSFAEFHKLNIDQELKMIELNVSATTRLAHAVLQNLVSKNSGGIISLSSIAGFQPLPLMATYSATKAFNFFHNLSLHHEYKKYGIKVLTVCPGPVATEFGGVARVPGTATGIKRDSVELVVEQSLMAYAKGRAFVVPGMRAKFIAFFSNYLPKTITSFLVYKSLCKVYETVEGKDGPK